MKTFDLYAASYDLLYGGKDYAAEAAYVRSLLPAGVHDLLELGCGTGGHAAHWAQAGLAVHGVDLSPAMLARAQERRSAFAPDVQARLRFDQGDARHFRAGRHFDAVVSLFHVMSYQTGNDDLLAALRTARAHLVAGGHFAFDFWYGPAVLSDRPRHVVKTVADERVEVRRETTPTLRVNHNCVDVRFDLTVQPRDGDEPLRVHEVHAMRYLFLPELAAFLAQAGFGRPLARAWMKDEAPDDTTWYASVVAVAE